MKNLKKISINQIIFSISLVTMVNPKPFYNRSIVLNAPSMPIRMPILVKSFENLVHTISWWLYIFDYLSHNSVWFLSLFINLSYVYRIINFFCFKIWFIAEEVYLLILIYLPNVDWTYFLPLGFISFIFDELILCWNEF